MFYLLLEFVDDGFALGYLLVGVFADVEDLVLDLE